MSRLVILGLAMLTAGCGDSRVPTYPVSGTVKFNGRSPDGWIAVLHPEPAPAGEHPNPLPRAKVRSDGRYQFRTYETGDGAPAGTYRISFVHTGDAPTAPASGDNASEADEVAKPAKAEKPNPPKKKSRQVYMPHTVEVVPGENELPPFEIK